MQVAQSPIQVGDWLTLDGRRWADHQRGDVAAVLGRLCRAVSVLSARDNASADNEFHDGHRGGHPDSYCGGNPGSYCSGYCGGNCSGYCGNYCDGQHDGATVRAMTVDSLTSISVDPPLVMVAIRVGSAMIDVIERAGFFAVSVLSQRQQSISVWFASRRRPVGVGQFRDVSWFPSPASGAPLLAGSLAWCECRLVQVIPAGDHLMLLGAVTFSRKGLAADPLLRFDGGYRPLPD